MTDSGSIYSTESESSEFFESINPTETSDSVESSSVSEEPHEFTSKSPGSNYSKILCISLILVVSILSMVLVGVLLIFLSIGSEYPKDVSFTSNSLEGSFFSKGIFECHGACWCEKGVEDTRRVSAASLRKPFTIGVSAVSLAFAFTLARDRMDEHCKYSMRDCEEDSVSSSVETCEQADSGVEKGEKYSCSGNCVPRSSIFTFAYQGKRKDLLDRANNFGCEKLKTSSDDVVASSAREALISFVDGSMTRFCSENSLYEEEVELPGNTGVKRYVKHYLCGTTRGIEKDEFEYNNVKCVKIT